MLDSAQGVQQGDPLGPALFALAIHECILDCQASTQRQFPDSINFTVFYLDDGVVAGSDAAVAFFCAKLKLGLADVGLEMSLGKCEVIPAARTNHQVDRASLFGGYDFLADGDFKLLGPPIGSMDYCDGHTKKRKEKAKDLLAAVGHMTHTQGSLKLLRRCVSFAKLMYSARTVPPILHGQVLSEFGQDLRSTLEELVGDVLPERCWSLAQMGIAHGGLGIRDPGQHGPAAYVASILQSRGLCQKIDGSFDPRDVCEGLGLRSALEQLSDSVLEPARPMLEGALPNIRQKKLSQLLDAALKQHLLQSEVRDAAFRAHVGLCSLPGAGAWLTAPVVKDGRELDAPLFNVALKRRLRMKVFEADDYCPACGDCLDSFGDHVLVCPCKGDRTVRHNNVRDEYFKGAVEAALRPEKEKTGLLPGRPDDDGVSGQSGDRRPADVWLPRGLSSQGVASDFACTSALRSDLLSASAENPAFVFDQYETFKKQY